MAGGIIILTRETKIAEMKLSGPTKNDFQLLKKSVQKKLKIFAWEIGENLKNFGKSGVAAGLVRLSHWSVEGFVKLRLFFCVVFF